MSEFTPNVRTVTNLLKFQSPNSIFWLSRIKLILFQKSQSRIKIIRLLKSIVSKVLNQVRFICSYFYNNSRHKKNYWTSLKFNWGTLTKIFLMLKKLEIMLTFLEQNPMTMTTRVLRKLRFWNKIPISLFKLPSQNWIPKLSKPPSRNRNRSSKSRLFQPLKLLNRSSNLSTNLVETRPCSKICSVQKSVRRDQKFCNVSNTFVKKISLVLGKSDKI